ncbi:MAG: hypothetical protein JO210_06855, partial [Acidobacteriaceae bacterium]|nr:hypothetical protein [Acidobacteriaceae bacterium]
MADSARHRVYFSVQNEVVVLSSDTFLVERELPVGSLPKGLALSSDGQKLYVALSAGGSLVVVDLNTFASTTIEVATQLGTSRLSDVLEVHPGVVLVSGLNLVSVDLNHNNAVTTVAGKLNAGAGARMRLSLDGRFVYVGCPALNEFIKLDNSSTSLPVIAQSAPSSAPLDQFALSVSGDKLIDGGGAVYDTTSLQRLSSGWANGVVGETADDSAVLQIGGAGWSLLDGTTLRAIGQLTTDCAQAVLSGIAFAGVPGQWLINLGDGSLCVISTVTPSQAPGVDGNRALSIYQNPQPINTVETIVGYFPYDMVLDAARDRFYVSLPQQQQLVSVAATAGGVVGSIAIPGEPGFLQLSADDVHLYVGLRFKGSIVVIDLTTSKVVQTIDLSSLLAQNSTGKLFELSPGDLLVGGPPQETPAGLLLSYAVELNPSVPKSAHRIGNTKGYCFPHFTQSPDGHFLYIDGPGCATVIEKRDLTRTGWPVVMTSDPADLLSLPESPQSSDGSRLYLPGMYVLDTTTLRFVGYMAGGEPFLSKDGSKLFSVEDFHLSTWDIATQRILATAAGNCQSYSDWGSAANIMWPDRSRFAILSIG